MANTPPAGLMQPTMASLPPGAENPRHAGIIEQQNANARLLAMTKIATGGRRRNRRGGADVVNVPQFQMQYKSVGGPGSSPNNQIQGLSSTSMQSASWSAQDSLATSKGGRSRRRKASTKRRRKASTKRRRKTSRRTKRRT